MVCLKRIRVNGSLMEETIRMKERDKIPLLVIGGGASGMMAAIAASRKGMPVVLFEHEAELGKKILATGNGRCNFTNERMEAAFFRSGSMEFVEKVLGKYGKNELLMEFLQLGIPAFCRDGYYYPNSQQAVSVRDVLERELVRLGVRIFSKTHVTGISLLKDRGRQIFSVQTVHESYECDQLILAAGGCAQPKLGADGSGIRLAGQLGHTVVPVCPALTAVISDRKCFARLKGIRVRGRVSVWEKEQFLSSDEGEIQLADYGISGIPVFQVSRYIARACLLKRQKNLRVLLDFLPGMKEEELLTFLQCRQKRDAKAEVSVWLSGLLNDRLLNVLYEESAISIKEKAGGISKEKLCQLAENIKKFPVPVTDVQDFQKAQVTSGGVSLKEVNAQTMESKKIRRLYLTGELLDVDGICGGYNLQWAFSTGYLAGCAAAEKERGTYDSYHTDKNRTFKTGAGTKKNFGNKKNGRN